MSKQIIIDVREPSEFAASHVSGAVNIPLGQIGQDNVLTGIDKDDEITVYCRSGGRSGMALNLLKAKGFSNVTNGINEDHVTASLP